MLAERRDQDDARYDELESRQGERHFLAKRVLSVLAESAAPNKRFQRAAEGVR